METDKQFINDVFALLKMFREIGHLEFTFDYFYMRMQAEGMRGQRDDVLQFMIDLTQQIGGVHYVESSYEDEDGHIESVYLFRLDYVQAT